LAKLDQISKLCSIGLDDGTAFEVLSTDIADIDAGDNIGAKLQIDQAEAKAEKHRAMALAI